MDRVDAAVLSNAGPTHKINVPASTMLATRPRRKPRIGRLGPQRIAIEDVGRICGLPGPSAIAYSTTRRASAPTVVVRPAVKRLIAEQHATLLESIETLPAAESGRPPSAGNVNAPGRYPPTRLMICAI